MGQESGGSRCEFAHLRMDLLFVASVLNERQEMCSLMHYMLSSVPMYMYSAMRNVIICSQCVPRRDYSAGVCNWNLAQFVNNANMLSFPIYTVRFGIHVNSTSTGALILSNSSRFRFVELSIFFFPNRLAI